MTFFCTYFHSEPFRKYTLRTLTSLLLMVAFGGATAQVLPADPWDQARQIVAGIKEPKFKDQDFLITRFGAREGDTTLCTQAIAAAIEACASAGGGRVVVPKGIFYTGPITLKSNVNLHLADGCSLRFSTNPSDYTPFVLSRWEGLDCYNFRPLIYAYKQTNIAITGNGVLDGQADAAHWWPFALGRPGTITQSWHPTRKAGKARLNEMADNNIPIEQRMLNEEDRLRPPFIQPYECQSILIEGVTIIGAPFWLIHPLLSEDIIVRGVTMESHGPNNDGCDPESCRNVLIENCHFNTGDDCIAIKSGRNNDGRRWNRPSENIVVRNCTMLDGHGGVVIGSEISGNCRNVFAENCTMDSKNLERVLRIKSNSLRGGIIENVYMRNITVGACREAIFRVEMKYEKVTEGPYLPLIRNINMENITSKESRYGIFIDGLENAVRVEQVNVRNCRFDGVTDARGNLIIGAGNVRFSNVFLNGKEVTQNIP
jgi:polygalacturonase